MRKKKMSRTKKIDSNKERKKLLVFWKSIRLPILAFLTAFLAGAILIIFTDLSIYALFNTAVNLKRPYKREKVIYEEIKKELKKLKHL